MPEPHPIGPHPGQFADNPALWSAPVFERGRKTGLLWWGDWLFLVTVADPSGTLLVVTGRLTENQHWLVSLDPTAPRGDENTCPLAIRSAIDDAARGIYNRCKRGILS